MVYQLRVFSALLVLTAACGVKPELGDSASDTLSSGTGTTTGDGGTHGHSQTSNQVTTDLTSAATSAAVTTASPSEPDTVGSTASPETTTGATDGTTSTTSTTSTVTSATSTSTTDNPISTSDTGGGLCNDPPAQPMNSACTDPSGCGCASGVCFVVPALGGFCGECKADADCLGGGCTVPDPVHGVGSFCNQGAAGDGCGSDAVCSDPGASHCGLVLEVPGIISVSTCGQCETDADCGPGAPNCTPDYDLAHFSGQFACKPDASVPNDSGCASNAACASGFCGEASVMGLLKLGICGECLTDADCGPGKQCTDPMVDLDTDTLVGSNCM